MAMCSATAPDLQQRLCGAVDNGDPDRVRELLAQGADPPFHTRLTPPALMIAATGPNPAIIPILLDALPQNLDQTASSIVTVAYRQSNRPHYAENHRAFRDHALFTHHAQNLENGLSFSTSRQEREIIEANTLISAIKQDRHLYVRKLLRQGLNPNARNERGETALHHATAQPDPVKFTNILLDAGADPHLANDLGDKPIHWAARSDKEQAVAALLSHSINPTDPNTPGHLSQTGLHLAILHSREPATIHHFLDHPRINLGQQNFYGNNAPDLAKSFSSPKIATLIDQKYQAELDATNRLMTAVQSNNYQTVTDLLSTGTNPDIPNQHNQRPIHIAALQGSAQTLMALLYHESNAANPNIVNADKKSPLVIAIDAGREPAIIQLFTQHPAIIFDQRDTTGRPYTIIAQPDGPGTTATIPVSIEKWRTQATKFQLPTP